MASVILLNKPFRTLCQFSDACGRSTLADFINDDKYRGFYPAGRLDYDSEGLVLLTDDGALQHRIAHPSAKLAKGYWVQVEGIPNDAQLRALREGVALKEGNSRPATARVITEPSLWPRHPPIRQRRHLPSSWLDISLKEGKNRQVRRMTAAVKLPTLRLVRHRIGHWDISGLAPGEFRVEQVHLPQTTVRSGTQKRPADKPQRHHHRGPRK